MRVTDSLMWTSGTASYALGEQAKAPLGGLAAVGQQVPGLMGSLAAAGLAAANPRLAQVDLVHVCVHVCMCVCVRAKEDLGIRPWLAATLVWCMTGKYDW